MTYFLDNEHNNVSCLGQVPRKSTLTWASGAEPWDSVKFLLSSNATATQIRHYILRLENKIRWQRT